MKTLYDLLDIERNATHVDIDARLPALPGCLSSQQGHRTAGPRDAADASDPGSLSAAIFTHAAQNLRRKIAGQRARRSSRAQQLAACRRRR